MNLTSLSKEETKRIEKETLNVDANLFVGKNHSYMMRIQDWYYQQGFKAGGPVRDKAIRMNELLGVEYLYKAKYEYLNVIWGLSWEGNKFVLMLSQRGIDILLDKDFDKSRAELFMEQLSTLLHSN